MNLEIVESDGYCHTKEGKLCFYRTETGCSAAYCPGDKKCFIKPSNKEKEMIDLTKPQILTEPVKCWVRDTEEEVWLDRWLFGIKTNKTKYRYVIVDRINHKTYPDIDSMLCLLIYQYCTLTDPYKPKRRLMIQEEAIAWACTEGAVGWQVRCKGGNWIHTNWLDYRTMLISELERRTVRQIAPNKYEYGEPIDFTIEVTE